MEKSKVIEFYVLYHEDVKGRDTSLSSYFTYYSSYSMEKRMQLHLKQLQLHRSMPPLCRLYAVFMSSPQALVRL